MGGHGHDGPAAVARQHVVGHVDRHARAVDRVDRIRAGEDAIAAGLQAVQFTAAGRVVTVGRHLGDSLWRRDALHQRVLRGQHGEGQTVDSVGSGGVDGEARVGAVYPIYHHLELDPLATPDPVTLHGQDVFRPVQCLQVGQQFVGVGGDTKVPLFQVALMDGAVAAPADAARLDLLVGQDGLAAGAPPLASHSTIGQATPVQQQEEPLRPAVELRCAGVDLSLPVVGAADQRHLAAVVGRVTGRRLAWVDTLLDRLVLRRQAEGVPAHRVEHSVPFHAVVARDDVGGHVIAAVTDAQAVAGGVGEEVQAVESLGVGWCGSAVDAGFSPAFLPFGLDGLVIVHLYLVSPISEPPCSCSFPNRR